jgi:arylsulfatase A-like enzyme
MQDGLIENGETGAGRLAGHAAVFAAWLTAAFAVAGYTSGERYPGYYLAWTALILLAGLVVPLGALEAIRGRVQAAPLASAYCVVFAGALSLDAGPPVRPGTPLGAARLLLLGATIVLAGWSLARGRRSRLGLGPAMALLCLAWALCGLLNGAGMPARLSGPAILLPLAAALAVLLSGLPHLDPLPSRFRMFASVPAAGLLALLPFSPRAPMPAVHAAPAASAAPKGGSAILIVLDTVRRDHMSLYGYHRKTTPSLDSHASRGLVFDEATAVAPWTFPSHASMFTGLWPRTHGARAFLNEKDQGITVFPLPPERVTLAEIARENGYRTAGMTANFAAYLSPRFGLDQGFDEYLCRKPRFPAVLLRTAHALGSRWDKRRAQYQDMPYFTAPEITEGAISWLERNGDEPFFLFLNYMEAHIPNAAPGSQGLPFEDEIALMNPDFPGLLERVVGGGEMTPAEQRSMVNEYDRERIHLDRSVGVLLDYVEKSGLGEKTLVVLTSDHGEFLGEHSLLGHGKDLYAEVVDVPLILWEPGRATGRDQRPVQILDVFPTILRHLGAPIPEGTQGRALPDVDHPSVSEEYYFWWRPTKSLSADRFNRVIRTIRSGQHRYFQNSTGEERLYDLSVDPGETKNLIAERPEVAATARAELERWLASTPEAQAPAKAPEIDRESLENLKALGYVR